MRLPIGVMEQVAAGGGGAFSPDDITGLIGWFDADDIDTLWQNTGGTTAVTADGQDVLNWSDKSTNGWDISHSTGGLYQTSEQNSLPLVQMGTGDYLMADSTHANSYSALTMFIAMRAHTSHTTWGRILAMGQDSKNDYNNTTSFNFSTSTSATINVAIDNKAMLAQTSGLSNAGVFLLYQVTLDTSNPQGSEIFVDGTSEGTASAGIGSYSINADDLSINTGAGTNVGDAGSAGYYGEILIYDSIISGTDKTDVETYMDDKWAISGL